MARARLLALLLEHSYRYDPSSPFRLASGKTSPYYIDCKATTMRGEASDLVGEVMAGVLPEGVAAVGGLTMGADPIAHALASWCTRHGRKLDWFSVRKQPKAHGTRRWVEGSVPGGTRVAVIDDVVTTGGSTIDAIERCREEGLEVGAVLVLVDREENDGLARIGEVAGAGVPVRSVFRLSELRAGPTG